MVSAFHLKRFPEVSNASAASYVLVLGKSDRSPDVHVSLGGFYHCSFYHAHRRLNLQVNMLGNIA